MVVVNELGHGFDLDKIDAEIKIEKIRQTASKLSWDDFQQALRRNLMEKRFVFDTEGRIDLLQAISTIRRNLPVDRNADLPVQLRQLSDSLECILTSQQGVTIIKNVDIVIEFVHDSSQITSCKIGYFGKPPIDCEDAVEYVRKGDFGKLRSKIFAVIATIPNGLPIAEKNACVIALDVFEAYLSSLNDRGPSFENIGSLPQGFLLRRAPLRPARIFYTVEPSYVVTRKTHLDISDFENLDYMELSVVAVDKEVDLPAGDVSNPWSTVVPCKASFQLRFSSPMLFSYGMWRRLERHLAKPAAIKENVNLYRYMSGFKFQESELVMRTCFPDPYIQQSYTVSNSSLTDERDCIISEICIGNGSNLSEIIAIIRAQTIHNSLWESLLAMSSGKRKIEQAHVDIRIAPSPARYELSLCAGSKIYLAKIELTREFEWIGSIEDANGSVVSADLNSLLTQRINRTRSIPVSMVRILKDLGCEGVVDRSAYASQEAMEVDHMQGVVSSMDKVGNAWLPMFNRSKQPKKSFSSNLPDFTFEVHTVPLTTPGGLLASYKEITSERGTRPPAAARAEARTHLVQSDTALAISDLEAICQLADGMDDDSKTSTPSLPPARHSSSPASSRPPGCMSGSTSGQGVPQLSPLETARLKMTHSVGAAAAVGLASAAPDVFEFADDRSIGAGSAYPSPSPQFTPFAYGTAASPISGQSIRGVATKRRPRARKTANMGDRIGDFTPTIMKGPSMAGVPTRKPRGKTGVRRPRGSRKANLTVTHAELELHSRAPPLQRSYSDYEQLSNPGLVGVSTSPYVDTESDDECDPPPPPKSLTVFQSPGTSNALNVSSATNSPSHSMSPLYVTSGIPSASAGQPPQSPLSAASPSVGHSAPIPSPRANQQRKKSIDAVIGRLKTNVPQQNTQPTKRSVFSDLYDDGTESPPPPEERISLASTTSSISSASVTVSPVQSAMVTTQASTSSPRVSESVKEQPASSDLSHSTTPTVNIEGSSKLILKIPKVPSRSSPSVDAQKTKSVPMQTMPKLEKQEKKREKEKKDGHKERSKEKSDETRKQKRKAEGKEKEREHKKHKMSNTPTHLDTATPSSSSAASASVKTAPLPFGFVGSLKNFKIPKREEVKENGKDKEILPPSLTRPLPPAPPTLQVSTPSHPSIPLKSTMPKKISVPIPPPPIIPMPRQPLLSTPPSVPQVGAQLGVGPMRKPPALPDHRDRRSMIGVPPFRGNTSSIPLPKGPPPPQTSASTVGGTWIRPPSHIPTQSIRSPSPDPNAMQIDDDLNSPEDSLRIADD